MFRACQVETCYGDLVYVNGKNQVVRYWWSGTYRRIKFYFGWMPPHPTFFVRRHLYDRYGAFDTRHHIAADYELMLRFILKNRVTPYYINRVLVRMNLGGKSNRAVSNIIRSNFEVYRAWQRNGLALGYLVPFLKPASKVLQFMRRP